MYNTFSQLRSRIQLTQNRFKLIKFDEKAREPVRYEDIMVGMTNISVIEDDNCLTFKYNVEYAWARFMQVSKMIKESIMMLIINLNLVLMREHLNNRNLNKKRFY